MGNTRNSPIRDCYELQPSSPGPFSVRTKFAWAKGSKAPPLVQSEIAWRGVGVRVSNGIIGRILMWYGYFSLLEYLELRRRVEKRLATANWLIYHTTAFIVGVLVTLCR